jgi:hypothetical protein
MREGCTLLKFNDIKDNYLKFRKKATKSFLYYGTGTGQKSRFLAFFTLTSFGEVKTEFLFFCESYLISKLKENKESEL